VIFHSAATAAARMRLVDRNSSYRSVADRPKSSCRWEVKLQAVEVALNGITAGQRRSNGQVCQGLSWAPKIVTDYDWSKMDDMDDMDRWDKSTSQASLCRVALQLALPVET
jgi:hypothetical protein